jgi:hypothetical protein
MVASFPSAEVRFRGVVVVVVVVGALPSSKHVFEIHALP